MKTTLQFISILMSCDLLLWGCGQPPVVKPQRSADSFSGAVVDEDHASVAGALVTLADATTGEVLAFAETDRAGQFIMPRPNVTAAFSAVTESGMSYVSDFMKVDTSAPMVLTKDCVPLEGHIELTHLGEVIDQSQIFDAVRQNTETVTIYGIKPSKSGGFRICVPSGFYRIESPEAYTSRTNRVSAPSQEPIHLRVSRRALAKRLPVALQGLAPQAIGDFIESLGNVTKVIGIGETNHGSREFSDERIRLAIELSRRRGFNFILMEAGYGESLALDAYIGGVEVDIARAVQQLGYWPWDTKTFLDGLERLRAYNATLDAQQRIRILGFDVQDADAAIELIRHGREIVLSPQHDELLLRLGADDGKSWLNLGDDDRVMIRGLLQGIAASRDTGGIDSPKNRVALAALSVLLRLEILEAPDQWESDRKRDSGMARMVLAVLDVEPQAHMSLWAHLFHVGRVYSIGSPTAGEYIANRLGNKYRVYALLAYSGSARAWDKDRRVGVIPHRLPVAPAHSLEDVLAKRGGAASITYWDFSRASGDTASWLRDIHDIGAFGAIYRGDQRVFAPFDTASIEGAILFGNVTPTVPTPTGERSATPKR